MFAHADDARIYNYTLDANEVTYLMSLGGDKYYPLTSIANLSDDEPANSKAVNFKDFAVLADDWRDELLWP